MGSVERFGRSRSSIVRTSEMALVRKATTQSNIWLSEPWEVETAEVVSNTMGHETSRSNGAPDVRSRGSSVAWAAPEDALSHRAGARGPLYQPGAGAPAGSH